MTELEDKLYQALKANNDMLQRDYGHGVGPLSREAIARYEAIAAAEAAQPDEVQDQDGWKHDCAALLTNDVELWIDSCPHCGKPRPDATHQDEVQRAVEAEREACARVCEDLTVPTRIDDPLSSWITGTLDCANAIRARSNKH